MNSLLITFDFPPIVGGISTVFYNIWTHLAEKKFLVLAPKTIGCAKQDEKSKQRIIRKYFPLGDNILKKIARAVFLYAYILQLARKERIDIIICGQPIIIGFIGLVYKRQFKKSYYVCVYGGEVLKYRTNKILLKLLRIILNNADKIITNSDYTSNVFKNFKIDESKLLKVTPAVDAGKFRPGLDFSDLIKKYSLQNKRVIISVGRLVPRKGNDMVVKSLKIVKEKIADIIYLIVGEGPYRQNLENLAKELCVQNHVVFAGSVSDEDLPKYYNLCDIYVLINRETDDFDNIEGFGITFIEAGACKKPVIGGMSGGSSEAVLDGITGYLVNPLDVDMLAEKIITLLANKDFCREMGRKSRQRILECFQWEQRAMLLKDYL